VSAIWKCISEIWGIPCPCKSGAQNHLFRRVCNLTATLTAFFFGTKNDIHNQASALEVPRVLVHYFKMSWTLVHKQPKIGPAFLPTFCNFCILLYCQASQTEISKQNSNKLCQMVDSKLHWQSVVEKSGSSLPKSGVQKLLHLFSFRQLRDLMVNIFWIKQEIDNRVRAFESTRGPLRRPIISWTLVHKWLKIRPEFLPILHKFCVLRRGQALHTEDSKRRPTKLFEMEGGTWCWCQPNKVALHSECKWNYGN